ncbi:PorV/PorQ family protein [candidate division KSB1 bacterium]|nr:PorV/PorQ family protein [candidate division KSB1 bacterium]
MKRIVLLFALLLTAAPALTQGNIGQAGANFLQIDAEPRGAAMGGAVTALSQGATALYWNPAGIISTENMELYLGNTQWFMDTQLAFGGLSKNLGSWGVVGISVLSFYMDATEITTVFESEGTGETYDAGDLAAGLSYARSLTDRFTFGVTAKYVREFIWNQTASQVALDVGSLYRTDFYNLRIGMVVRNFSGKLEFNGDDLDARIAEEEQRIIDEKLADNPRLERLSPEFRLPQIFRLGIAFEPWRSETALLTLSSEVDVPSDNQERLTLAGEFAFANRAFLRAAYLFRHDIGGFSVGAGLAMQLLQVKGRLDYAYSDHEMLGGVHRMGVGLCF